MLVKLIKSLTLIALIFSFNASAVKINQCMTSECVQYFKSFKKASRRGHSNAMYNLAKFYHLGFGTEIDKARALKYYKKSALRGTKEGAYQAGLLLMTEEALYDFDEGVKWLERASRNGQPNAAFLLGQSHFNKQNYADADIWLSKVYQSHPKKIVSWIEKAQQHNSFNDTNLPALHQVLTASPIETFKTPEGEDDMEVFTITAMHRDSVLDQMLDGFRKRVQSTGTRLPTITCDQNVACVKKSLNEMKDSIWVSQ